MRTDTYLQAADWHRRQGLPCQDMAIARIGVDGACLAVSDGCSSGQSSELGAMAVAHSLVQEHPAAAITLLPEKLRHWKALAATDDDSMLATAVRLAVTPNQDDEMCYAFTVWGDGMGGATLEDGTNMCWLVDWDSMPPYPWYDVDGRMRGWSSQAKKGELTIWHDGVVTSNSEINPDNPVCYISGHSNWVAAWAGSDGWLTLGKTVPEISTEMTAYKNTAGSFLKRRVSRWLSQLQKSGIEPSDDLGVVAIIKGD